MYYTIGGVRAIPIYTQRVYRLSNTPFPHTIHKTIVLVVFCCRWAPFRGGGERPCVLCGTETTGVFSTCTTQEVKGHLY